MGLYDLIFGILHPKSIFCNHEYKWEDTIHGDSIRYYGWKRTIYKCPKCGKEIYLDNYIQKNFDWSKIWIKE